MKKKTVLLYTIILLMIAALIHVLQWTFARSIYHLIMSILDGLVLCCLGMIYNKMNDE